MQLIKSIKFNQILIKSYYMQKKRTELTSLWPINFTSFYLLTSFLWLFKSFEDNNVLFNKETEWFKWH